MMEPREQLSPEAAFTGKEEWRAPRNISHHQSIQSLLTTAHGFLRQGKFQKALETFTAILTRDPHAVAAYNGLGIICGALQKYARGQVLFRRGLALEPDNAVLHYNYGGLLAAQGRLSHARAEYGEALRCRPGWAQAANKLGMVLCKQGRYANALEVLSANLKFNPRNPEIRNTIKQVLAEQEAARQMLKKHEKKPEAPLPEPAWDGSVTLSGIVDMLRYLARLAEYLPAPEREQFISSNTPSTIFRIMELLSKPADGVPE
ncbi:MAG: tetratricopeptide repeat protein [Treponema sp.]|jgi:Tfp pilus assembly protein PilF|nr:tetratricopeptide repeat protein [Treponema sp.]